MSERLTKWEVNGCASVNGCSPIDADMAKAINRLCDFEDKICDGRMVELPCKVGQTVYYLTSVDTEKELNVTEIFEGTVQGIGIDEKAHWISVKYTNGLFYYHPSKDFGKTVFLTPEEANKKLKELGE